MGQRGALLEHGCSTALGAALDLTGLPGGEVIHLPLQHQCPCLVFFSSLLGSQSDAWSCCSSKAGTLDTLADPGDNNLFMQVVLRSALSLMVTELSLYHVFNILQFILLPFHTSRSDFSSTCFFVLCALEWFWLWLWLWSQSLLYKQVRNPRSTLQGWRGLPHALLALTAPVTLRITNLGT